MNVIMKNYPNIVVRSGSNPFIQAKRSDLLKDLLRMQFSNQCTFWLYGMLISNDMMNLKDRTLQSIRYVVEDAVKAET